MIVTSPYAEQLDRIPVRVHEATILGSRTAYWSYGDPDAAITIVLVHGFRGDHHGVEPIVAHLSGFHLISPDLPGFGASQPLAMTTHDIEGYGVWLRAFIAELAITGRLVILGHSFGSIIVAASLAAAQREHDQDLLSTPDVVLVNPIAANALKGPRAIMTWLAVFYYWIGAVLPERAGFAILRNRIIVRVMSVTMAKSRDPSLRKWIHNQHDRYFSAFSDRRVVLEAFRASVSHDVSEYAPQVRQRTLLVAAERDDISTVASQRHLATLFPNASLEIIPAVGHLIHYEAPGQAAEKITAFLSGVR